ncbi:MAG: amino acid adenylation domain-containing protein [Proteobacteria bacterium]|nr:amino acid adenylation domain-containing protein [Pseudomonadota bacterium]
MQAQAWSDVPRGTPLFENAVVFDSASLDARMAGHAPVPATYEYLGQTSFPLTLIAYGDERLLVRLEYLRTRVADAVAQRLHAHLLAILTGLAGEALTHLGQLKLLSDAERQMALYDWNPLREFPSEQTLHATFAAQVARVPGAIAVTSGESSLTYAELDRRANQLAHRLLAAGVTRNQLVALRVERSEAVVIGILGILKSGAAYLPLDPVYPKERIAFMLEDSEVRVAVTEQAFLADFAGAQVSALTLADASDAPVTAPDVPSRPDDLAYIIYTSGSTGRPKGVRVTHRNVVRLMDATQPWYGFNERDVWTLFHSYSFDWTVFELWGALAFGGRLVVVPGMVAKLPDEFRDLVQAEGGPCFRQTPSAFRSFIQADSEVGDARYALRYVIFGGEALELQSLAPWFDRYGDQTPSLVNMYGITETTVHVTYRPIRRADLQAGKGSVVGVPIPDLQVYILDRYGDPAPIGVTGEIHVGGAGVALGYLNRAELTAQRFVPDPFRRDRAQVMYRSGDLARRLEDGDIECLGRGDDQVKIRGFRIELGEIESQIAAQPVVQSVCVMAREDVPGDKRLAVYVVPRAPADGKLAGQIKARLRENLPQYMVPADFVFLDRLPLTSNGKVDRRALPAPNARAGGEQRRLVAPGSAAEAALVDAWKSVLRLPDVSTDDNFFALGGDSILIIQIISRCRDAGLRVTPRMIFDHPVLADLAARAGTVNRSVPAALQSRDTHDVPLSPIQQWFFAHSFEQPGYWNQAYLFRLAQPLDEARLRLALSAVASHHDALRLRYPLGEGGWRQLCVADASAPALRVEDLTRVSDSELPSRIEALGVEAQSSLDIHDGPVLTAVLMRCGQGRPDRLLLAVHHLVIDGVSWRPLLEDLETACLEGAGSLAQRARGASFPEWVAALQAFASTPAALAASGYWQQAGKRAAQPAGHEGQLKVITQVLDADATRRVMTELPALFRTQANDALLAALLMAERQCGNAGPLSIDMEGHGREDVVGDLDVSRTIGWFTALFPLSIDAPVTDDPAQVLLAVKEHLRKVPHRGLSHGVLRAFAPDPALRAELAAQPPAGLLYNYLGQSDALVAGLRLLQFAPESTGPWHGPRNRRTHAIEALAVVRDGRFEVQWSFDPAIVPADRVEKLSHAYGKALGQLAALAQPGARGRRSPSDFPLATLAQNDVDSLWKRYPGMEDAHRLAPMQRLLLLGRIRRQDAGAGAMGVPARGSPRCRAAASVRAGGVQSPYGNAQRLCR